MISNIYISPLKRLFSKGNNSVKLFKKGNLSKFSYLLFVLLFLLVFLITKKKTSQFDRTYTFNSELNVSVEDIGINIESSTFLGKTQITLAGKSVDVGKQKSIQKVVGIHPEFDEQLNATLVFQYNESDLNGLDEEKLILYSSRDNGKTWQPHNNSVVDTKANIIHLEGIEHFSLWTAAMMPPPITLGTLFSVRHINLWYDVGDNTFVSVTTSHLIPHFEFTLGCNVNLNQLCYPIWKNVIFL